MATAMTTERLAEIKQVLETRKSKGFREVYGKDCLDPLAEELIAEVERLRSLGENRDRVYDAAVKDQADSR